MSGFQLRLEESVFGRARLSAPRPTFVANTVQPDTDYWNPEAGRGSGLGEARFGGDFCRRAFLRSGGLRAPEFAPVVSQTLSCAKSLSGKHHVVVQYMARWMKCPLPPSLDPPWPGPLCVCVGGGLYKAVHQGKEDKEGKEESTKSPARDFALQLP